MDVKKELAKNKPLIDKAIEACLPRKLNEKKLSSLLGKARYAYDVKAAEKSIHELVWDLLDRGGKRWRPSLLLWSARALGFKKNAMPFAAIPEVIHNGCMAADALVWMADGTPKTIPEIKVGDDVLSLDGDFGLVKRRVRYVHDNGVKEIYRVSTNNRELRVTAEHPFLVAFKQQPLRVRITCEGRKAIEATLSERGETISSFCEKNRALFEPFVSLGHLKNSIYGYPNCLLPMDVAHGLFLVLDAPQGTYLEEVKCKFEKAEIVLKWKKAKELSKGDVIVVARNVFSEIRELPELKKTKPNHKDRYSVPDELTEELAQLCGFLVGDGYIGAGRVVLCLPATEAGRREYEQLVERVFEAKPSLDKNNVTICSKAVAHMLSELGLNEKCLEKKIPAWVFKLPENYRKAFLKGYIDADASFEKKGAVRFDSANERLTKEFKFLLDSMGFVTSNVWTRVVDNTHFGKPVNKQNTTLYGFGLYSTKRVLEEVGTEIESGRQRLSMNVRERLVDFRHAEEIPNVPDCFDIKKLGFNQISEVRLVGKEHTYDLQVEGTHNYIANGVVVHNTLVIDDLEDGALIRRGKPCLHVKYGVDLAVNAGSGVYFIPLLVISKSKLPAKTKSRMYEIVLQEMTNLSYGQGFDIYWHRGLAKKVTEKQYLQMCAYKTGTLARMSARLGAALAGASLKQEKALSEFAEALGVAFQIQDDILNLIPEDENYGKTVGEDITEGKRTLMVIHALGKLARKEAEELIRILNSHTSDRKKIDRAIALLKKSGSIDYALQKAQTILVVAWKKLDRLLKESEDKKKLKALAWYAIERTI